MKAKYVAFAALAAAPVLVSASAPLAPNSTLTSSATPPERFQGEGAAIVLMVNPERIDELCGSAPPGYHTLACTKIINGAPVIAIPNPCIADAERYAHILCHEKAHVNGWPATHGD